AAEANRQEQHMDAERDRQGSTEDQSEERRDDGREKKEDRRPPGTAGGREEWARLISEADLLQVMSDEEIFSEATEVYDNYVDALETGSIENLQAYARELSERIIPRGVETHEVLGIVLLLRDALARSLFAEYR